MSTHDWRVRPEETGITGGGSNGAGGVSSGGAGVVGSSGIHIGGIPVAPNRASATPDIMLTMSASELLVVVRAKRDHMQSVLGNMASVSLVFNNAMVMNQLRDISTCAERCIELLDHITRNSAPKEPA